MNNATVKVVLASVRTNYALVVVKYALQILMMRHAFAISLQLCKLPVTLTIIII